MRIAISGSHSLGKSTLVRDFQAAHPTFELLDEPYRELVARHERIHFAERASQRCNQLMTQHAIERITQARLHTPHKPVICDRSCLDFIPYSHYARAMGSSEGLPLQQRLTTAEVRPDMQEKNGLPFPSDINAAFIEQLWDTILNSQALSSYDLIAFLPLTGDPGVDPSMESDGIRSVETAYRDWVDVAFKQMYRDELPRRSPQPCRVVEITGSRSDRVQQLEQAIGML
ncbi:AAA family ATPase [Vulcanococcus sp.]|uniref:AAA family ATPase n=1 Tax=Vulcanococcus sp. TaxID=2856995 RepID=UPI003F6A162D